MKSKQQQNNTVEILIAEDSPTQAEKLQYLLEKHGYAVLTVLDGKQALTAAQRRKPALIVSDVVMPEMDGFTLCGEIKRIDALKDVPVILLTSLSDARDIMRGLECGADNFIRKPYDEQYLLARINYLLMNNELRKSQRMQLGMEIYLGGQKHLITAERQQIVDLLISVYEEAVHISEELKARQRELADSNRTLTGLYHVAEGLNHAVSAREVCERALEHALELPGVRAGWISLWENDAFKTVSVRNLPPTLLAAEGLCNCQRRFLAGELDRVTNILECEWLKSAAGDALGLHYHASIPLWVGGQTLGIMNLVGADQGQFRDDELETLYGIGHQVGIALERARLHEHLEQLVEERTSTLTEEIAERKRIQEEQARLVAILEATPDLVGTATPDGRLLYTNQAGFSMLGWEKNKDLSRMRIHDVYPEWAAKLVLEEGIPYAVSHGVWSGETALLGRDGREIPILQVIIAHKGNNGELTYFSTIGRDISRRKMHEARIVRLNRIYSVLSGINTTIVRAQEQQELFDEACRIAVEHGKFTFAWIGRREATTQQVIPVAKAGFEDGYLSQINLTAKEDAPGNCQLAARALTQAIPMVCNDIAADECMKTLRHETLRRGYRSVAVLPLIVESQPIGVFVLYAPEANVFDDEEMVLLIEMAGDISFAIDHLEKEERLNYLAYFDAITGLPNRALFLVRVDQRIAAAHREQKMFSVIMLDLERFSNINESLGRQAGDLLLRQFAERLKKALNETNILARLSADYFGIATQDDEGATITHILEKIFADIQNQPFLVGEQELRVSAKAGISSYPADGHDAETLLRNAEAALKKTKASGDKYMFYAPEFNARVAEKLTLENRLRRALEQEELVLHYQPKVDLKSGQICGLEALLRWNDPEIGLVPPAQFIPLLEETGMILEAGRWVLVKAVSDSRAWQANGLRSPRIAVNVSPIQLRQKDFVNTVERVISGTENAAVELEIEITESLIMQDIEANIQKLRAIRDLGMEVAIDDFGTGYSSLSYIAKLPVNVLKIDRAFIINMASNSDDLSIVSTIISLAHSLNLRVVAEGVETEEQANLLRLLKCNEMQGFLFSPAVSAEQIQELLQGKKSL